MNDKSSPVRPEPHVITPQMALDAMNPLDMARDAALLAFWDNRSGERIVPHLEKACAALGFTLSPASNNGGHHEEVTTPPRNPVSGRPSLDEPAAISDPPHEFVGT